MMGFQTANFMHQKTFIKVWNFNVLFWDSFPFYDLFLVFYFDVKTKSVINGTWLFMIDDDNVMTILVIHETLLLSLSLFIHQTDLLDAISII